MADVLYTKTDNLCYGQNLGNVIINQIIFTTSAEQTSFASYSINWTGDFYNSSQISDDGKIIEFLSNGNYSFTINSLVNASVLGPYNITISSPPELIITNIDSDQYSCFDGDASMTVHVSGGLPPYTAYGFGGAASSASTKISINNLVAGTYSIYVLDANNCKATWPQAININNSVISATVDEVIAPVLLDSYGTVKFNVSGLGPFSFKFEKEDSDEVIFIGSLETKYITDIDTINNIYSYKIHDQLTPGTYSLYISNNFRCSYSTTITIPNIIPISVNCTVINNDTEPMYDAKLTLPIFDCLFIPYKHIQDNTSLWQLINNLKLKDVIHIKINNEIRQYRIVRGMLNKYCLDENKIEILRLGNDSKDWFYYIYIAPSINLTSEPDLVNASYSLVNKSDATEYPINLGINEYNTIDSEKASLIKGSFLLTGLDHDQFGNNTISSIYRNRKNNAYVSIGLESLEEYDFFVENISKSILKNIYAADYVTSINFLDNFHRLVAEVNINDTACNMTMDEYQYVLSIKNLLKTINNFNHINNIYIYNLDYKSNIGQVLVFISGNSTFLLENSIYVENTYDITYYTFDDESTKLNTFYENNQIVKTPSLKNLQEGYVIIRIKDIYNNIPRLLSYNNTQFNYDNHFSVSKNIIQKYNKNITQYFQYGDILVYVGSRAKPNPPIDDVSIPRPPTPTPPEVTETPSSDIVYQTPDATNTSSLSITLYKNIKCILIGPKNYRHEITKNTEFKNLIPGVYTITGNVDDLYNNNLYQQEYRILIDRDTTNTLDIDFASYQDQTFIKEV